jgi:hypothetical protein
MNADLDIGSKGRCGLAPQRFDKKQALSVITEPVSWLIGFPLITRRKVYGWSWLGCYEYQLVVCHYNICRHVGGGDAGQTEGVRDAKS